MTRFDADRNPLALPSACSPVVAGFLSQHRLDVTLPPLELLVQVSSAFARLPYENLTKILKYRPGMSIVEARRGPAEVWSDHVAWGTGGTCFSLTATLLHLLRGLGWTAEPLLADRRYGADTHTALRVWIEGRPHLLDPGYLIVQPIPIESQRVVRVATPFHELVLEPRDEGRKLDLFTEHLGQRKYRLTFKTEGADDAQFLRAWDASFQFDMMQYPVLTRTAENRQLYLQDSFWQVRSRDHLTKLELSPEELVKTIGTEFGIDPQLAAQALAALRARGEAHGAHQPR